MEVDRMNSIFAKLHPNVVDQFKRAVNELHTIVMSEKGCNNNGLG